MLEGEKKGSGIVILNKEVEVLTIEEVPLYPGALEYRKERREDSINFIFFESIQDLNANGYVTVKGKEGGAYSTMQIKKELIDCIQYY